MTSPRRTHHDTKVVADAVAKRLQEIYPPQQIGDSHDIITKLDRIDDRLKRVEEHMPMLKSLHSVFSVSKGFGKVVAWAVALAAASATVWTFIKNMLLGKAG